MDINVMRSLVTVLGLLCFVGICVWAFSKHARKDFDEAAHLPLTDDDAPVGNDDRQGKEG